MQHTDVLLLLMLLLLLLLLLLLGNLECNDRLTQPDSNVPADVNGHVVSPDCIRYANRAARLP